MTAFRVLFALAVSFALAWVTFASLATAGERGRTLADYNIQKESAAQPLPKR